MIDIPRIQNAELKNKIVLIRVDHNVVKKGVIKDPYRIDASIDTINYIIEKGGKPILMTHVGRPRDKKTGEIKISSDTSVVSIVQYLKERFDLNFKVAFDNNPRLFITGKSLNFDDCDGWYLPNTRWFSGEESKDVKKLQIGEELAGLADIFVNDAFGSWQPHASTVEITKHLPSYAGFLMQKEIDNLEHVLSPEKPFLAVVAGSKFDTKIGPLTALLERADHLILGGVLYNAYLCAKYGIKIKGITEEDILSAKKFVELTENLPGKLIEIPFIVESDTLDSALNKKVHDIISLSEGCELNYVLDADPESFQTTKIKEAFSEAKTIFVNAVMGLTPYFNEGTIALDESVSKNHTCGKYFGGGDTLQEFKTLLPELYNEALADDSYYFFTGGGTILKAINEGKVTGLYPVKALIDNNIRLNK